MGEGERAYAKALCPLPQNFINLIFFPAQIGLDDPGVPADIPGGAGGDDLAVVQDDDPVAQAHNQGHVVFDDQQGNAQGQEFLHQGHEVLGLPGVEAGGGLIHEQELGLLGQGPGDFQAPLVAVGQGLGGFVLFAPQAHQFQEGPGPGGDFRPGPFSPRAEAGGR